MLNGEDVAGFSSLNLADLGYVVDKEISNFIIVIDEERQYRYNKPDKGEYKLLIFDIEERYHNDHLCASPRTNTMYKRLQV